MLKTLALGLLPIALLAGGVATAQRPPRTVALDQDDDGRILQVPVGTEFEVTLPQRKGVPARWELRPDTRLIAVEPPRSVAYGHETGAREERIFLIRVTQAGRIPMTFDFQSTWAGDSRSGPRRVVYRIEAGAADDRYDPRARGRDADTWSDDRRDRQRETWSDDRRDRQGETWSDDRPIAPAPAIAPAIAPLREADSNRVTRVPAGREIVILLPSNASTGYRWEVIASRNVATTRPIEERDDPRRPEGFVGSGGTSLIRLRPTARGAAEVTLAYRPPIPTGYARQVRFRFMVE